VARRCAEAACTIGSALAGGTPSGLRVQDVPQKRPIAASAARPETPRPAVQVADASLRSTEKTDSNDA